MYNILARNIRKTSPNLLTTLNYSSNKASNGSKKEQEKIKTFVQQCIENEIPDRKLEEKLRPMKENIKKQVYFDLHLNDESNATSGTKGDLVRQMKADKQVSGEALKQAIAKLNSYKSKFQSQVIHLLEDKKAGVFDQLRFNEAITRRFFYNQAFSIYETNSGFYDFGPVGFAIQSNLINEWRKLFVFKDYAHEIECAIITPENVLKASGHLEKFSDAMVRDEKTGESFRVDHLLKSSLERKLEKGIGVERVKQILKKLGNNSLNLQEIDVIIEEFAIRSPQEGNKLTKAEAFNLMFQTAVGPFGTSKSFLRPETAQGIFVNFKNLFKYNHEKLPMVIAQVGKSFRNEISPKMGLIRQREFLMAEIEHFLNPKEKYNKFERFQQVGSLEVSLLSADDQLGNGQARKQTLGDAVKNGIIKSETVAYYIGKAYLFAKNSGVDEQKLRFRQHLKDEMAHYADDCWDLECQTHHGWIECAGIADRCDYDLKQHSQHSGQKLSVEMINGTEKYEFTPHVIEPSFGIGRILYTILEHTFRLRQNDAQRSYFAFPALIAPYKCSVLPLVSKTEFDNVLQSITDTLVENNIAHKIDCNSDSIGRRYAKSDEIGISYAITIDYESLSEPCTVTIRDRDSMEQVRIKKSDLASTLLGLINGQISWEYLQDKK